MKLRMIAAACGLVFGTVLASGQVIAQTPTPFQAPELTVYLSGASAPQNLLGALANSLFRTDLDPVLGQFQINVYFDNNNTPVDQTDDGTGYRAYYGVMTVSYTHLTLPTNREV